MVTSPGTKQEGVPHPTLAQLASVPSTRHPGVICGACAKELGDNVRYKCLDCGDFDLCEACEKNSWVLSRHFHGNHIFCKIRDSTQLRHLYGRVASLPIAPETVARDQQREEEDEKKNGEDKLRRPVTSDSLYSPMPTLNSPEDFEQRRDMSV